MNAPFHVFAADLDRLAEDKSAAGLFLRIMLYQWRNQAPLPGGEVDLARALHANIHTVRAFLPKLIAMGVIARDATSTRIEWMERRITEHVNRVKAAREREEDKRERRAAGTTSPGTSPPISPPTSGGNSPQSLGGIPGEKREKNQRNQRNDKHEKKHEPIFPTTTTTVNTKQLGVRAREHQPPDVSAKPLVPFFSGDPSSSTPLPPALSGFADIMARAMSQLAPDRETAARQLASEVEIYGEVVVREAVSDFRAAMADKRVGSPTWGKFAAYCRQVAKRHADEEAKRREATERKLRIAAGQEWAAKQQLELQAEYDMDRLRALADMENREFDERRRALAEWRAAGNEGEPF